jgi:hypothetical protein
MKMRALFKSALGHVNTYFGVAVSKITRAVQLPNKLQLTNLHLSIHKFHAFISYTEAEKVPWPQV